MADNTNAPVDTKTKLSMLPKNLRGFLLRFPVYYLIVVFGMYFLQDYLLYPAEKADPAWVKQSARTQGLKLWPQAIEGYRGFISEDALKNAQGTILVFHGNAGTALDRRYYVGALERLGYRVLLAEYPGYGARPGKPSEQRLIEDAVESARLAVKEFGRLFYILGESLGCGVASGVVASGKVNVDGVALITPWDSLPNLAQAKYWFIPAKWMVRDKYDNVTNLKHYRGPVAVAMAAKDEIIPTRLTRRLYEALGGPKRLWTFPNAGHNSWPSSPNESWWNEMMAFLQSANSPR